jgi:hypothetical protein
MLRFLLTTEATIHKFFNRCQQFFLPRLKDTGIRGARFKILAAKKSLTGINQFNTLIVQKKRKGCKVVHNFSDSFAYYYRYNFYGTGLSGVR